MVCLILHHSLTIVPLERFVCVSRPEKIFTCSFFPSLDLIRATLSVGFDYKNVHVAENTQRLFSSAIKEAPPFCFYSFSNALTQLPRSSPLQQHSFFKFFQFSLPRHHPTALTGYLEYSNDILFIFKLFFGIHSTLVLVNLFSIFLNLMEP